MLALAEASGHEEEMRPERKLGSIAVEGGSEFLAPEGDKEPQKSFKQREAEGNRYLPGLR